MACSMVTPALLTHRCTPTSSWSVSTVIPVFLTYRCTPTPGRDRLSTSVGGMPEREDTAIAVPGRIGETEGIHRRDRRYDRRCVFCF